MGLDVYLTRHEDREGARSREKRYEELCGELSARNLPDAQERAKRQEIGRELGLDEWGEDLSTKTINEPSALDPEHYFKIGYFRSSYNEGGLNSYVRRVLGVDGLYEVFPDAKGDAFEFQPDWAAAKQRALDMAGGLADHTASQPYDVLEVRHNPFVDPKDLPEGPNAALGVFRATIGRNAQGSFGSRDGEFFLDKPLSVRAAVLGKRRCLHSGEPEPAVYLVFDAPNQHEWYATALRIVAETCDYVLRQPDVAKYWLRWSA